MLELISRYRQEIMGFAIIWVVLFHIGYIPIINIISSKGYGGVDIFLFLSGFGLFYSFAKDKRFFSFYRKRFLRVYPSYAIVVLVTLFGFRVLSLNNYLICISTIGFWTGKLYFEWYIPSLFIFYLSFPLLYIGINKYPKKTLIFSAILCAILVFLRIHFDWRVELMLFFTRIPIFVLGTYFGKLSLANFKFEKKHLKMIPFFGLFGVILLAFFQLFASSFLWTYGLYWFPFIFICPALCLFFTTILDRSNSKKFKNFLSFFGLISLELYLLHIKLFEYAQPIANYFHLPKTLILLAVLVVTIPLAYYLSRLNKLFSYLGQMADNRKH